MRSAIIAMFLASMAVLTGCQSSGLGLQLKNFFGSRDPCAVAEDVHAAFLVFAAHTPKVTANAKKAERAAIASVREYCSAGNIKEVQLKKIIAAYGAAVDAYKNGE